MGCTRYLFILLYFLAVFLGASRQSSIDEWTQTEISDALEYIKSTYEIPKNDLEMVGSDKQVLQHYLVRIPKPSRDQWKFHVLYDIDDMTTIWKHPIVTIGYALGFIRDAITRLVEISIHIDDNSSALRFFLTRLGAVIFIVCILFACATICRSIAIMDVLDNLGFWFIMGVASSVGFGFGFHTFTLYLGPKIVEDTLKAIFSSKDSAENMKNDTIETALRGNHGAAVLNVTTGLLPSVIAWGAGTAFGEMPPFLLSGGQCIEPNEAPMTTENTVDVPMDTELEIHSLIQGSLESRTSDIELQMIDLYHKKRWYAHIRPQLLGKIIGLPVEWILIPISKLIVGIVNCIYTSVVFLIGKILGCVKSIVTTFLRIVGRIVPCASGISKRVDELELANFVSIHRSKAVLILASFPNPLFDLVSITCAKIGMSWNEFLLPTLIGKSLIKAPLQTLCLSTITANSGKWLEYMPTIFRQMIQRRIETQYGSKRGSISSSDRPDDLKLTFVAENGQNADTSNKEAWIASFASSMRTIVVYLASLCFLVHILQLMAGSQIRRSLEGLSRNRSSEIHGLEHSVDRVLSTNGHHGRKVSKFKRTSGTDSLGKKPRSSDDGAKNDFIAGNSHHQLTILTDQGLLAK